MRLVAQSVFLEDDQEHNLLAQFFVEQANASRSRLEELCLDAFFLDEEFSVRRCYVLSEDGFTYALAARPERRWLFFRRFSPGQGYWNARILRREEDGLGLFDSARREAARLKFCGGERYATLSYEGADSSVALRRVR